MIRRPHFAVAVKVAIGTELAQPALRPKGSYWYRKNRFVEITEQFPLTVSEGRFRGTLRNKRFFAASVPKTGGLHGHTVKGTRPDG
jgi:hypothetical protein